MDSTLAVTEPYGDVRYADPGYRDATKRYPIDTPAHIRAAWAYINMPRNAGKYTADQLDLIKGRIRAAAERHGIQIAEDRPHEGPRAMGMAYPDQTVLLAGAAPLAPPSAWFGNPGLSKPTKMTITEDGRVFGHLAQWRVCHVGIGNACIVAPKSRTNYGIFRIGSVVCDDGSQVPVGKIVMGSAHANAHWGVMPARDFYDNTSMTAAVVNIGEDRHGIWVNGALTVSMTPEKIAELRASALSGDWRMYDGSMELIAALAVNSPGFPIYREADGRAFSMMAVGVLDDDDVNVSGEFSMADNEETTFTAPPTGIDDEQQARMDRAAALKDSLHRHQQERRMTQLASIVAENEELTGITRARDSFDVYADYKKRFKMLPESLNPDDEEK